MTQLLAVTGADGFIGSHLVERLVRHGYRVRALAQYNAFGSWGWLDTLEAEVMANVEVRLGDVRDAHNVRELLEGVHTVYHLAALIAVPYSYRSPRSYLDTNVAGTMNVLEAAKDLGTPRIVHTSTSEVYGTARSVPITEDHPLQAQSPYAASKIAADKFVESFHASYALPVVTLRPFNTFGPRQSTRAVLPSTITQIAAGKDVIQLGALEPTRDFNFVADIADAFLAVGAAPLENVIGQTLNAGTGTEISVGAAVQLIARLMNRRVEVVQDPARLRPDASEVMRLVCDSTRLRQLTGWQPAHSLEAGLEKTIAWFSEARHISKVKAGLYGV